MGKICKIVVCGMKGVGKTSILEQVIYGNVSNESEVYPTIEDIYEANVDTDKGTKEKIRFYDTAGIEFSQISTANGTTNQQLPRHYLTLADGYILVYDTQKPESLDVLVSIKRDIDRNKDRKEVNIIVIGNRTSNVDVTAYPTDIESIQSKASAWCNREKLRHFVASAWNRQSLYEPFVYIASKLNPPATKSSFTPLSMGRKVLKDAVT